MNHRRGEGFYKKLLSVDMLGIWVAQNAGSLVPLCATIYCMEQRTQNVVLALYALGSFFSLYKAMTAKCPWQRRYSFLLPFFFRMLVLTARTTGIGRGNELSLWHLFIQVEFLFSCCCCCNALFYFIFSFSRMYLPLPAPSSARPTYPSAGSPVAWTCCSTRTTSCTSWWWWQPTRCTWQWSTTSPG